MDVERLLRLAEQGRQLRGLQLVREFPQGLIHGFHRVDFRQLQGDVAGGGLAQLDEIINEPLHPGGLPGQDLQVLLPVLLAVGLLQKVHIVDDGGQGGLDVVGHVGNKLRAHPLGAHLLLGRQLDHVTQAVELHRKVPEGPQHQLVVQLDLQVAPPHPLGSVQKGAEDVGPVEDHRRPGSQEKQHPEAVPAQDGKEQSAPQRAAGEEPLPGQRQQAVGPGQEPPELFPDPFQEGPGLFHQAQYPLKDRQGNGPEDVVAPGYALPEEPPAESGDAVPPPVVVWCLELGGAGEAEAHEGQAAQVAAVAVIDKGNGVALAHEIPDPVNADIGIEHAEAHQDGQIQVQGQAVQPAGADLLAARLMARGAAQIHRQQGKGHQADPQQGRNLPLMPPDSIHQGEKPCFQSVIPCRQICMDHHRVSFF